MQQLNTLPQESIREIQAPQVYALPQESIREIQESSNEEFFKLRKQSFPNALVGIAEGDSWFDYAPAFLEDRFQGDLINQLNKSRKLNILRIATAGDTLENMAYATDFPSPQLDIALRLIDKYQPDFFLFSGGGNDVAGPNGSRFEPFLNHVRSNLDILRRDYLDYMIHNVFFEMFEYLIKEVIKVKSNIQIFLHGYGYVIPDGRPVFRVANYNFIGPWFGPVLTRKKLSQDSGQKVLDELIDNFNKLLENLSVKYSNNVRYIDLCTILKQQVAAEGDYKKVWGNELHLTVNGFKVVAEEFQKKINQAFPTHSFSSPTRSSESLS